MDRMDIFATYEYEAGGEKRTGKIKIGTMFPHRSGGGVSILVRAMPAPENGQYKMVGFPPLPKDDRRGPEPEERGPVGIDDDIPF